MENEKKKVSSSEGVTGRGDPLCGQLLFTIALSGPLVFQTVFRVDEQGFALDLHFTPGSTVHPNSCVKLQVHYSLLEFFFYWF